VPSPAASKPDASTPFAIQRYFDISLYLLIATGFVTLASTGKLDLPSHFLILAVLVTRGVMLVRNRTYALPVRWTNWATLGYVLFYAADFFLFSGSFVYATVHLVLFSMAIKIFSVQRERDHVSLALLSFLMVLAAAVLTVESTFFFAFTLFVLLATATFITMEMKRAAAASPGRARESSAAQRNMAQALSWTAVTLVLGITVGGFVLFFLLPRQSGGYLSAFAQSNQFATGFSNDVELGRIGEIKQMSSVVMHVQIEGDIGGGYASMKWRGLALSMFDGHHWTRNPFSRAPLKRSPDGNYYTNQSTGRYTSFNPVLSQRGLAPLRYRVLMEPIGTDVFFVAPFAVSLGGRYRSVAADATGALFSNDEPISVYEAYSNLAEPSQEELRAATGELPFEVISVNLQLPLRLDPRVARLASSIAADRLTPYDKAVAIEDYLKSHYIYTLELPQTPPADPIGNFLFQRREGHCEYFASAMAIMLRTQRIPSRLITGFRGAEFNDLNSTYIVRASSAHTWVEAYFPGAGWVTFDPTPPDPKPVATRWSRLALYADAMGEFWREWIINYDFTHQLALHNEVFTGSRQQFLQVRESLRSLYHRLLERVRLAREAGEDSRKALGVIALLLAMLVLVCVRAMVRAWKRRSVAQHPENAPSQAAALWYQRLTRTLARRGCEKRPSQTPVEFARSIPDIRLRDSVSRFTEHYERARFGESSEDARELPELYEEVVGKR